ncbi:MAG TPA: iron ABC transporter permease [Rhizomicrobium sp.]|jgi:iron complex transport system permease protein|nr:iron ABC transporter permease [Rhizomicrobium sp.]
MAAQRNFPASLTLNGGLIAAALALAIWSLTVGYVPLPPHAIFDALIGHGPAKIVTIVWELRAPRIILAYAVGFAMGLAGAVLQGLLRNPLAEPGVVGVTSSASLGAVIAIYFGLSVTVPLALPLAGIAGAAVATAILLLVAQRGASPLTLILCGIAINGMAVSLVSLAMNLSPNPWAISEIAFWLMGSVRDRSLADVALAVPMIALGSLVLVPVAPALDALSLGEDAAESLGFPIARVRLLAIVGTSLAVGGATAVAGGISFVGLVVPHLLRPLVGHLPSRLMLPSALGGGLMLVAADMAIRAIATGPELGLGVVTALIGTPVFLYLIFQTRQEMR